MAKKKLTDLEVQITHDFEESEKDLLPEALTHEDKEKEREMSKVISKNIIRRAEEIRENTKDLSDEEREFVFNDLLKDYKLDVETLQEAIDENLKLPPSSIFNSLGWLPISEMMQRIQLKYDFTDLIPFKIIENGLHRIFYRDFRKADGLSAYKQSDYTFDAIHNPPGGIVTEEIWNVYRDIHAGFTMWSPSLNQNTRDIALFIAMFNELEWNIQQPIAVELYRIRLKMIAEDLDFDGTVDVEGKPRGTDWSKLDVDVTIHGTDDYDALMKLNAWMTALNQSSRNNLPTRWNPPGMTNNLMTKFPMSDFVLITTPEWAEHLDVIMRSGRFNDNYIKTLPEIHVIDYNKSFGEFNGDTGYSTTYQNCDMRLVSKNGSEGGSWIIAQYDAVRSQPNLNLTEVVHYWTYDGHAFHRLCPIFRIKFISDGGTNPINVVTKPSADAVTTGNFDATLKANSTFTATQTAANTANTTANTLKTSVGDVSTLTTTAKTVVPAINEVNAKPAGK